MRNIVNLMGFMWKFTETAVILMIISNIVGCTYSTSIIKKPIYAENNEPLTQNRNECMPAILSYLKTFANEVETNPDEAFRSRLLDRLNETGLFSDVRKNMPPSQLDKYVSFNFVIHENRDSHYGASLLKSIATVMTVYLLAPVLPLKYDFESEMKLNAIRSDGASKTFYAKSQGTADYYVFASPFLAGREIEGKVTTSNLNSIMNQMIKDKSFFME